MKKTQIPHGTRYVVANCNNKYWPEMEKDECYILLREFFRNGETHYKLLDHNIRFEAPACFFDDTPTFTLTCKTCNATWTGKDEHAAEVKANNNPCDCAEKAKAMSTEELLAKINETKKG